MVGRTKIGAVKEGLERMTVSELVISLKSAFQNSYFTQVEEILVSREEKLKTEIEGKNRDNKLLLEELQRLREERDGLLKRVEENEGKFKVERALCLEKDLEMKKGVEAIDTDKNADNWRPLSENIVEIDGESASPESARGIVTEVHLHKADSAKYVVENEPAVCKDKADSANYIVENEPAVRKRKLGSSVDVEDGRPTERDNWRPLSENIVEIEDESASPESARGIVTEVHLHKADSAKYVVENEPAVCKDEADSANYIVENEPAVCKPKLGSSVDVEDGRPTERGKQVKIEEPAAPILQTSYAGKGEMSSKLLKILSELGDDSSSSSGSDDEVDLSLDYATLFRTRD
ncbi:uncharacterized protein [Euphorbia lathyris]|uniref:uncharacterized protein n=1 Tax=Euphorbia lathyris TaxID=212925 RepID=UPI003314482B